MTRRSELSVPDSLKKMTDCPSCRERRCVDPFQVVPAMKLNGRVTRDAYLASYCLACNQVIKMH